MLTPLCANIFNKELHPDPMRSKKELAVVLSKLATIESPSVMLEQYSTPSELAASWIWDMAMLGDVRTNVCADFGCGAGVLGLGLLLLGAKKVYFLDKDAKVMHICVENYNALLEEYDIGPAEFLVQDVHVFDEPVNVVVQNPPFGTKEKHADKHFLEAAFSTSPLVWSMHKWPTRIYIDSIAESHSFKITHKFRHNFWIKAQFNFHKKPTKKVDVGIFRMATTE